MRTQINISLPVEMRMRMKAVERRNVTNWSKTCQRAIEAELAALEGRCDEQRRIEEDPDAT
jgi:hypothetical protein